MEFLLGLGAGILLTLVLGGVSVALLMARDGRTPLPEPPPGRGEPAVTVMMVEPFLNHQMQQMTGELDLAELAPVPGERRPPFALALQDVALDVLPGRHARFYTKLTATAWRLNVPLRPVTDLLLLPQNGLVKIVVTKIQLGALTIPRTLVDRFVSAVVTGAEAKLNHSLTQFQRDTNVLLSDVETTPDLLILKFTEPQASPVLGVGSRSETVVQGDKK